MYDKMRLSTSAFEDTDWNKALAQDESCSSGQETCNHACVQFGSVVMCVTFVLLCLWQPILARKARQRVNVINTFANEQDQPNPIH